MKIKRLVATVGSVALMASALAIPAHAESYTNSSPQTVHNNSKLPLVNTYRQTNYLKANILNPYPVCNAGEDYRTVVYKVEDKFEPKGTISSTNRTDKDIQLVQTLSKTESLSVSYHSDLNAGLSATASTNNEVGTPNASITASLAKEMGYQISYSLSYTAGQQIGPYTVAPGYTGEATYGFRTVTLKGTQQSCKPNGTWGRAFNWSSKAPVKNEIKVKRYALNEEGIAGLADADVTDEQSTLWGTTTEPADPTLIEGALLNDPKEKQKYDLQPYLTVSSAKVPGYAGAVALRVKNVGTENYYSEFPAISFLVKVKYASGPKGVDRLITPGRFNGATVQDLGYDKSTSTRTFRVTMANLIKPGSQQVLLANFNFGDGLIAGANDGKRMINYIEVSQDGRMEGDNTYYNDYKLDSRNTNGVVTKDDFGRAIKGLF